MVLRPIAGTIYLVALAALLAPVFLRLVRRKAQQAPPGRG
jgi:hypothetical protein